MKGNGWSAFSGFVVKWGVGICFLVFLLLVTIGNVRQIGEGGRLPGVLVALVVAAVVLLLTMKAEGGRLFVPLLIGSALLLHTVWALVLRTQPLSDFKMLLTTALQFAGGDGEAYRNRYYANWGYQTGFSLYEAFVARVVGSTHALSCLKVLNGVWLTLTNYLIYLLGRRFAGERAGRTVALLFFLYAGAWSLSTVLTNQFMGTALLLSGLAICLLPSERRWFLLPLGGAVLALSNAIRSDAVIAAIAVALTFLLLPGTGVGEVLGTGFFKGLGKAGLVAAAFLGTGMLLSWSVSASGVNPAGLGNTFPTWKLIAGLNEASQGQYDQKDNDEIFMGIHLNAEIPVDTKKERESAILRERLRKDPGQWMKLFGAKSNRIWSMPDDLHWAFSHLEGKVWTVNLSGKTVRIPASSLITFLQGAERGTFLLLLLLGILGNLPWRRRNETSDPRIPLCFTLLLLAMAVLYLFVEVQLRYRISLIPAFFILAAPGAEWLLSGLSSVWHGNAAGGLPAGSRRTGAKKG